MRLVFPWGILAMVALCANCMILPTASQPVWGLRPGVVEFHQEPVTIEMPDTVAVGAAAAFLVRTYGGGCTAMGPTRVTFGNLSAVVEPFDSVITDLPTDWACTDELRLYDHRVQLSFQRSGVATIRILGTRAPGGAAIEVERTLLVQ